jgi:TetR/AcrR family transcriptional regulator, copper-responsive repressor
MSAERKRVGRPPSLDRGRALKRATELFWRHGYEGTSIAMLTEAMGVTPPTLYAAFGSKAELYRQALSCYGQLEAAAASVEGDRGSIFSRLERHLRTAAQHFSDPNKPKGCMVAVGSLHCGADNGDIVDAAALERHTRLAYFIRELEQAKHKGELPANTDADALARFYFAVLQGMSVQAIDGANPTRLHAMAEIALGAWPGRRS